MSHDVLHDLAQAPQLIPDPGDAARIKAQVSGAMQLRSAGTETRILMPPAFQGQVLCLTMAVDEGDIVVACNAANGSSAQTFDGTNSELTFDAVGESAVLVGYWHQNTLYWGEIHMEGVTEAIQGA